MDTASAVSAIENYGAMMFIMASGGMLVLSLLTDRHKAAKRRYRRHLRAAQRLIDGGAVCR